MWFWIVFLYSVSLFIPTSSSFDYYQIVQQWPPSYCYVVQAVQHYCFVPHPVNFTIHGLWPGDSTKDDLWRGDSTKDDLWLSDFTKNLTFYRPRPPLRQRDVPLSGLLMGELLRDWPDLNGYPAKFWSYEWKKHGKIYGLRRPYYFRTALKLKHLFNPLSYLADARIIPSVGSPYNINDIFRAISGKIGVQPRLHCSGNLLLEISICVSLSLQKIDCPRTRDAYWSCAFQDIYFLK